MTHRDEDASAAGQHGDSPKQKPYNTPTLRVYGDVPALTRSVARTTTNPDGGHGAMTKTH